MSAEGHVVQFAPRSEVPQYIESQNPATGEVLGRVPVLDDGEIKAAVARAREAQARWKTLSVAERGKRLLGFRNALVERQKEVCEIISREQGKTFFEALSMEVLSVIDSVTYFANNAASILAPEPIPLHLMKHKVSYLHFTPLGVVGIIAPWNFPFAIPTTDAAMAWMAGNAVVLKPSEMTPLIALKTKEIWDSVAGLDPDLFQIVTGYGAAGAALIDSGVDKVVFTGSTKTGRLVAEACGRNLTPCTLELGGKAPAIVCDDADLERAAGALTWGAFANSGQVCASVERVFVSESVYEPLVEKIVAIAKSLRQGEGMKDDVDIGALTFPPGIPRIERLVADAVAKGATLRTGGKLKDGPGHFFEPTVLTNVTLDMEIMHTESFGPLMPIMKVKDEHEALRHANNSDMALLGYVFSKDHTRARGIAEKLEVGTCMINDVLATHAFPETPWHGLKKSGLGVTHSAAGLKAMCRMQHVSDSRVNLLTRELWWYPYSKSFTDQMSSMVRAGFKGGALTRLLFGG
jgi:acyl-CoA reductase-like NAD-dependent aldehyde dehydrogenase